MFCHTDMNNNCTGSSVSAWHRREYKAAMSSGTSTFNVTAKNTVAKGKVEKVTLKSTKNPGGVKFFLYKRDNKVSFAIGDMGASVVSFKKEEVEIDEALPGKWPAPGVKKGTRKDLEKLEKELQAAKKKKDKKKADALQKELERLMKSGKGKKIGPAWMHKEETILDRIDRKLKERKNG